MVGNGREVSESSRAVDAELKVKSMNGGRGINVLRLHFRLGFPDAA